jgi:DNA-binding MarR family transcriptional regulator
MAQVQRLPSRDEPMDELSSGPELPVLEGLLGYHTRRAALHIIARFHEDLKSLAIRPVAFSVLTVVGHQPGITASEVCDLLGIQPPNLVGIVNDLRHRGWLDRQPHPTDGRALGLHLTDTGQTQLSRAQQLAIESDQQVCGHLDPGERDTLVRLLKKIRNP